MFEGVVIDMKDSPSVEEIEVVDSINYFPDSETYDGLRRTTGMAEDPLIDGDNPMHLGYIELLEIDSCDDKICFGGAGIVKDAMDDRFEHFYGSDFPENIVEVVLQYYMDDSNAVGYNGDASEFNWFARVEERKSTYSVRLFWSKEMDSLDELPE